MIINEHNKKIYQTVYKQKALTEQILGIQNYSFPFVQATYSANCIEAIDFTMFDKVICGILQIEEALSFEEIANILGLNVVDCAEEGKYLDYGEKEILEFALDALVDFNMIETGDIYYSSCRLTDLGKEYAAQGKKILPQTKKDFCIYFDLTDRKHKSAKERFEKLDAIPISDDSIYEQLDFNNEKLIREIAKEQVPEIYNPEQLNNITDIELSNTIIYHASFSIVILTSFNDNDEAPIRFLAFDNKQKFHPKIAEMIMSNQSIKDDIIGAFEWESYNLNEKSAIQIDYEKKAILEQNEIEQLLSENKTKEVFKRSNEFYINSKIVDEAFLSLHLDKFFDKTSKEFWIILNTINEHIYSKIKTIIEKLSPENNLIIITPLDTPAEYSEYLNQCSKDNTHIFFNTSEEVKQSILIAKQNNQKWAMSEQKNIVRLVQDGYLKKIEYNVFVKAPKWDTSITQAYKKYRKALAQHYLDIVHKNFNELSNSPTTILSKKNIEILASQNKRLNIFKNTKNLSIRIDEFIKKSQKEIEKQKKRLLLKLEKDVKDLEQRFRRTNTPTTTLELKKLEHEALKIRTEFFDNKEKAALKCQELIKELQTKMQELDNVIKKNKAQKRKTHHSFTKKR